MSIIHDLQEAMLDNSIKGDLATQLYDITEQYNEGILSKEEYEDLVNQIADIESYDELASDEVTSRWLINISTQLLSVI